MTDAYAIPSIEADEKNAFSSLNLHLRYRILLLLSLRDQFAGRILRLLSSSSSSVGDPRLLELDDRCPPTGDLAAPTSTAGVTSGRVAGAAQKVEEDLAEERRHEAVDEEVDGAVDDHEELGDRAGEEDPERDAEAVVRHILLVLLDCKDLGGRNK